MIESAVPPRPPAWEERWASRLFLFLSPHLPRTPQLDPPAELAPWRSVLVPRLERGGSLAATWYEAGGAGPPRGAVLLLHPWVVWGKAYFHLRGRIEALRAAGYHALALDFSGFGASPPPDGFFDGDVASGLAFLRQRVGDLPLHVWGVSSGGYWAHLALSRSGGVAGAMFEDVPNHLVEWSWRMEPRRRPGHLCIRTFFSRAYRFLDLRRHAPALRPAAVAYVSGAEDLGARPQDTRELAERAGGRHLVVAGAKHLGAIKQARDEVIALALDTFSRAEERPVRQPVEGAAAPCSAGSRRPFLARGKTAPQGAARGTRCGEEPRRARPRAARFRLRQRR
ncbi:MAG TPA: alpha/beta fold hydrolase [Thermoanaerobaculia bacterium]|nr:alpha/beta fold hydrolase [Thermoanaerobaculia bacterium]